MVPQSDSQPVLIVTQEVISARGLELIASIKRSQDLQRWFSGLRAVLGDEVWAVVVSADVRALDQSAASAPPQRASRAEKPAPSARASKIAWANDVLMTAGDGLTMDELHERAKADPSRSGYGNEPDFKTWLVSTAQRGRLKKRHGKYFAVTQSPAGGTEAVGIDYRRTLISALRQVGGRGRAAKIVDVFWDMPGVTNYLSPKSQYPYTLLSRLAIEGVLLRDGREYILPDMVGSEAPSTVQSLFQHSGEVPKQTA